jgi:hypothetical protein
MLREASMKAAVSERATLCTEIEERLVRLPENDDRGKLRGVYLRLRRAVGAPALFEVELQKLAALSEKIAGANPAVRLSEFLKAHVPHPEDSSSTADDNV